MSYQYYNANPLGRNVNDCAVRAISLAEDKSWDETYKKLAEFSRQEGITLSEVEFIDKYLYERYEAFCNPKRINFTVKDFLELDLKGRWLITTPGHITCVINGVCYDTFDPSEKLVYCIYKVKG